MLLFLYFICFKISVTQVRISVSPATIELINRCKATVVGYNAQEVKIVQKKEHLNLWDSKPFNEQDYWFLKTGKIRRRINFIYLILF